MSCRIIKRRQVPNSSPQAFTYRDLQVGGNPPSRSASRPATLSIEAPQHRQFASLSAEELAACEQAAYQRGLHDAEARLQEQLAAGAAKAGAALERSIAELAQFQKQLIAESEKQVARLALEIAKKIVRREVRIDNQIIMAMIKVALSHVHDARKMRIRVNPEDLPHVRQALPQDRDLETTSSMPELSGDPAIERGGFVIESDAGIVDARLGQQFQEIEKSFFGHKTH